MDNFIYFFKQGFYHIINWNALDHVLIITLLVLVFIFKDWKKILWLITLFTLGNLLMLLLSVYNVINVNYRTVEFLIPLTIFILALINIFTVGKLANDKRIYLYYIFSFFFGLIHGLSSASSFKKILAGNNKILSLLEYSVGVEVAQFVIAILVLLVSLLFQSVFRFSKRDWILIVSSIALGFVLPMLISLKFW